MWRNVTPTFVYLALKTRGLPVEGTGEASRDFIYVGDISAVIPAAFTVLRHGGALIFSCETADEAEGAPRP